MRKVQLVLQRSTMYPKVVRVKKLKISFAPNFGQLSLLVGLSKGITDGDDKHKLKIITVFGKKTSLFVFEIESA